MLPNLEKGHTLRNLVVHCQEVKKVNRKEQLAIVVVCEDIKEEDDPIELYAVRKHFKILREGPSDYFFETSEEAKEDSGEEGEEDPALSAEVQEILVRGAHDQPDVQVILNAVEVDDDNQPAPENVPAREEQLPEIFKSSWGHSGVCYRKANHARDVRPWIAFPRDVNVKPTLVQLFELFFPKQYLEETLLVNINANIVGEKVEYGELLRWFGLFFLMATIQGPERRCFWAAAEPEPFDGAPFHLNKWMSMNCFEAILSNYATPARAHLPFEIASLKSVRWSMHGMET